MVLRETWTEIEVWRVRWTSRTLLRVHGTALYFFLIGGGRGSKGPHPRTDRPSRSMKRKDYKNKKVNETGRMEYDIDSFSFSLSLEWTSVKEGPELLFYCSVTTTEHT